ncbi:hypothetical protein FRC09_004022 [Ceratobasidium sp. 395]|nr:hypothetical protein FRC09_004022 [Ceratobasidium sp. 395]
MGASVSAQTRDSPCVDPATPNHIRGVSIALNEWDLDPPVRYLFRRDEHRILVIGYDTADRLKLLGVCNEEGPPPATMLKCVQITWENNTVLDLGSPHRSYFVEKQMYVEPHTACTVADNSEFLLIKYGDSITIDFVYEDQVEVEVEATQTRSPSDHSQVAPSVVQSQPTDGSDSMSEHSQGGVDRAYIDLTAAEDDESDDEVADVIFLKVVQGCDQQRGASGGEGGRAVNQSSTSQGEKRNRTDVDQSARPLTRTSMSVSVGTQISPTPAVPPTTERSQIGEIGRMALVASAMWGALTFKLI